MKNSILIIIFVFTLFTALFSQCNGCNHSEYSYMGECEQLVNPEDCNPTDLQVIQDIINANGYTDQYEPIDFGYSIWDNGNLVYINLFYSYEGWEIDEFEYELPIIPNSLVNANNIISLIFDFCGILSIPDSIGYMPSLINLEISNNQLTNLPESICLLEDNWVGYNNFYNNYICTNYPECVDPYLGSQDCEWYLPGDVNVDGDIDILDITLVVSFILAFQTPD